MNYRELLKDKKRVVIKVGSSSLIHKETNKLDLRKLEVLVRELSDLHNQGKDVILVTSGAVAVGASAFGMHEKPTELLETRKDAQPLSAFCRKCRELGYEIYDMDLITAGEEFYATMRRSTNGGGENSPMLEGEDDFYELFFAGLE